MSDKKTVSRREFLKRSGGAVAYAAAAGPVAALAAETPRRPNVIFFLMDDMGWMDSTVYGSQFYETPNMERLAKRSMTFTQAYAANPLCSPTRASIITGKYPARFGITTPVCHLPPDPNWTLFPAEAAPNRKVLTPNSKRFLPLEEYTIAEALRDAGYKTCHVGKWHLGVTQPHWPEQQGFEVAAHGKPDPGPPSYFSPYGFKDGTLKDGPPGEYLTDRLTDEALKFITENRDRPFFLNFWHHAVHSPWMAKEDYIKRYFGKKDPRGHQGNPIMAAMLKSADESLGRLLDKLDELKLSENTILILFSDNGGVDFSAAREGSKAPPPNSPRAKMLEEYKRWADDMPLTSNYPLRGGKATVFEGGTREPMFVVWPGTVQPGSKCTEVVSSVDFYPTILEMVGLKPKSGQILDGESIMPLLKQTGKLKREAIFCHFPHSMGQRSPAATWVRKGDWKLIRVYDTAEPFTEPYHLYNLKDDLSETNNLAAKMPEKVKELDALIDKFLKDTGAVVPIPNPKYDPKAAALGGWVDKTDSADVQNGILKLQLASPGAFIATASLQHAGEAIFRLRLRSLAGGPGKMTWRTADQKEFVEVQVVPFDLPGDGQWHEVSVKVPAKRTLVHVRLYPASKPGAVEIDWIRLCQADGTELKVWDFGK